MIVYTAYDCVNIPYFDCCAIGTIVFFTVYPFKNKLCLYRP